MLNSAVAVAEPPHEVDVDLQELILSLSRFWSEHGCVVQQAYDIEVGAGTMHPETFLRVIGPEPYRVAYVQPSRRPADARFGENPFRFGKHLQMQVILKPSPDNVQALYLESLAALGIDPGVHDVRFEEDNWESPTLGAWGVGWQVLLDGMEITQFTYFQQAGGIDLKPISAELTYGLERIAMFLQRKDNGFEMRWGGGLDYGKVRHQDEVELSRYAFDVADVAMLRRHFEDWEREAGRCLEQEEPLVIPGLEAALKMSHLFNLMDARGAVAVTERVALIGRVRKIAVRSAKAYLEQRERLGFPLGTGNGKQNGKTGGGSKTAGRGGAMSKAEFLLELLCEEIPANALPGAREQLRTAFEAELRDAGLDGAAVASYSTVRRLIVQIADLPAVQPDREEEVTGPPVKAAYTPDGSPTPAAVGFAKGQGVPVDSLRVVKGPKGDLVAATRQLPGCPIPDVLGEISSRVVRGLHFPKTMRWEGASTPSCGPSTTWLPYSGPGVFTARVPVELFGVPATTGTFGHRTVAPERIELLGTGGFGAYRALLLKSGVEIGHEERRAVLEEKSRALAIEVGCEVRPDSGLLAELVELVEHPGVLRGAIAERFLQLPEEVLDHHAAAPSEVPRADQWGSCRPVLRGGVRPPRRPRFLDSAGKRVGRGRPPDGCGVLLRPGSEGTPRLAQRVAVEGALPPEARHVRRQGREDRPARRDDRGHFGREDRLEAPGARLRAREGGSRDCDGPRVSLTLSRAYSRPGN